MKKNPLFFTIIFFLLLSVNHAEKACSWDDKTHLAIARAAGYFRWYNAAGADLAKLKAGDLEAYNHYSNNPPGAVITAKKILEQVNHYNRKDHSEGHLYGAIIASVREYKKNRKDGKYAYPYLDYTVHYIGDLSQPLHNTVYNDFNKKNHLEIDLMISANQLKSKTGIKIYPVSIKNENDLVEKIAHLANMSMKLGYQIEKENRILTAEEAMDQISHSISLLKGLLEYLMPDKDNNIKGNGNNEPL
ncbi:hypothetical protein ACFL1N_08570 [Thermodesulfobacteriota bacterium]